MLFKINGERNSGTNFLAILLQKNFGKVYSQKIENNICYHWKHGIPDNSVKNNATFNVADLRISPGRVPV